MTETTFHFVEEAQDQCTRYQFFGVLDAHSRQLIESLTQSSPSTPKVILDFAQIGRINSMGLALLLKLLNNWEKEGKHIQVVNLNRMASVLFKITGLGRFLNDAEAAVPAPEPLAPRHSEPTLQPSHQEQLTLFASLQTSQQLNGWFLFNTYLQRRLNRSIQFQAQALAEQRDRSEPANLVFARPFEACRLIRDQGFVPLAKPEGETDEVVLLAHAQDPRSLAEYPEPKIAVASRQSFAYLLGRFLCDEQGLDSKRFKFHESGNDIKAVQFLIRRQVDWAWLSLKTYLGLSSLSRSQIRILDQSHTELAAYLFCAAPYLEQNLRQTLKDTLTQMHLDEKGKSILTDMEIHAFAEPDPAEVDLLLKVHALYGGS
jgi:anti-anti-sigma factor